MLSSRVMSQSEQHTGMMAEIAECPRLADSLLIEGQSAIPFSLKALELSPAPAA